MQTGSCRNRYQRRGGAGIILLNFLVLLTIAGLIGGYYWVRIRPQQASEAFEFAQREEERGNTVSAEIAYRDAVRLDSSNAEYHLYLDKLTRGEGNFGKGKRISPSAGTEGSAASPSLWLKDEGALETVSTADAEPRVNTSANGPGIPTEAVKIKNVEVLISAPGEAEYEITALNADRYVPGGMVQPWKSAKIRFQQQLPPGEYRLVVQAPGADPVEETLTVLDDGTALQTMEFQYGMLKIDSAPNAADIHDKASGERIGKTPLVALRPPGPVAYELRSKGYESSPLEGMVEERGVLHFNHLLTKTTPPAPPEREKKEIAAVSVEKKTEKKLPVKPATVLPALSKEPVLGKPFVNADGVEFAFGEKSNRGEPFWMSKSAPLTTMSADAAKRYCAALTQMERAAGRVPEGYGYFPSIAGDGRIALSREYYDTPPPPSPSTATAGAGLTEVRKAIPITEDPSRDSSAPVPIIPVQPAPPAAGGIAVGQSFTNGNRIWMEYRDRDFNGNPFWISAHAQLNGMTQAQANDFCHQLTSREMAAGRVPAGYAYAPSSDGDGRVVLWRSASTRITSAGR